jgi:hypothetical protein
MSIGLVALKAQLTVNDGAEENTWVADSIAARELYRSDVQRIAVAAAASVTMTVAGGTGKPRIWMIQPDAAGFAFTTIGATAFTKPICEGGLFVFCCTNLNTVTIKNNGAVEATVLIACWMVT